MHRSEGVAADLDQLAASGQVAKYLVKYGQVLVTNYSEFLLVTQGPGGKPAPGERYRLGESETAFWAAAAHPHKTAAEHGERLIEYLKRAMLHPAPLTSRPTWPGFWPLLPATPMPVWMRRQICLRWLRCGPRWRTRWA